MQIISLYVIYMLAVVAIGLAVIAIGLCGVVGATLSMAMYEVTKRIGERMRLRALAPGHSALAHIHHVVPYKRAERKLAA